jgi:AAA family ATP:ADP antiporter
VSVARIERLAMGSAGLMLAHLWAAKAVRSGVFLGAWDARYLPAMVLATAAVVVAAIPLYARLLTRAGPSRVVPAALLLSAVGHFVEWRLSASDPWVAVVVYLHIAGFGALLLSGFWSLANELFDAQSAKTGFGRIAAAGTVGGIVGGLAIERVSVLLPADSALLLLAALHAFGAVATLALGRSASNRSSGADRATAPLLDLGIVRRSPHLRTIALIVSASTAAAFVVEYLFQAGAQQVFPARADLQPFLARFYLGVGIATSLVQLAVGSAVRRLGVGRTISSLPFGLGAASALALVIPAFPFVAFTRAVELVLRASLYRSGYELLFVPMEPDEKRRSKTFLDVACDRAGDAVGATIVQILLLVALPLSLTTFVPPVLLAVVIVLTGAGLWLGRRLDRLYLSVVERRLTRDAGDTPLVVPSEVGWSVIGMPALAPRAGAAMATGLFTAVRARTEGDARLLALGELRSGDLARVRAALAKLERPDRMQVSQVISLLAWDDAADDARAVLERHAARHVGLLIDALLDPATDFAVRRRLPRVLAAVGSPRAVDGLIRGLDDERFEVRYQAARALDRLLRHHPNLTVPREPIVRAVERELLVPDRVWRGHRLIDGADRDDAAGQNADEARDRDESTRRNFEHVFTLLGTFLPRDAVQAAYRGLSSPDPHVRALAIEYLDSALPSGLWTALRAKLDAAATPSAGDARAQSGPPRPATRP